MSRCGPACDGGSKRAAGGWPSACLDRTAGPVEARRSHAQVRCHRRDPRTAGGQHRRHVDRVRIRRAQERGDVVGESPTPDQPPEVSPGDRRRQEGR